MLVPSWSKAQKEAFRTQHPAKYPIKQAKHNYPKANVKEFADLVFAADYPEYKGLVTIVRRPKGTTTMETVASVPAEQVGEWLTQMHVSADADYYITKAQFKTAQTWDSRNLFAINAIWIDIDAHEKTSNCPNPEDALSLLSQGIEIWTELPGPILWFTVGGDSILFGLSTSVQRALDLWQAKSQSILAIPSKISSPTCRSSATRLIRGIVQILQD